MKKQLGYIKDITVKDLKRSLSLLDDNSVIEKLAIYVKDDILMMDYKLYNNEQ